jgi:hypothetical protein
MHSHSERGGVLGSIFLVLGILALVAMVGIVTGGFYLARHVRVNTTDGSHGGTVDVETPFGSVHVREDSRLDAKSFGVPVYPGATVTRDHHKLANVELNFGSEDREISIAAGEYVTPDPIGKVREFYRDELPHWMVSTDRHGAVNFSFTEGGHKKIVVLKERGDVTSISLVSVGEPPAN